LKTLRGDWRTIAREIGRLRSGGSRCWVEIVYEGDEIASTLRERLLEAVDGSAIELLRVKNNRVLERALSAGDSEETLDDLTVTEVFRRCLDANGIPEPERQSLLNSYQEIVTSLHEEDLMAE
jgi:exonuclease SbcD